MGVYVCGICIIRLYVVKISYCYCYILFYCSSTNSEPSILTAWTSICFYPAHCLLSWHVS